MRIIAGPTVQLRLDLQYPAFRLHQDVLQIVGIHRRHPPGLPVLPLPTCCPPSPCTRLSRARTTTRTPPRPDAVNRRRACPSPDWMPGGEGDTRALPTFTTIRSTSEPPSSTPAASPRLRRRPSTWPPHRRVDPVSESPPRIAATCTAPGPYPPDWSRHNDYGASGTDSSRTASRLACRTRTVWQYQHVPALSGPLSPLRASPRPGCPQLLRPAATGRRQGSPTPARKWRRLVAH